MGKKILLLLSIVAIGGGCYFLFAKYHRRTAKILGYGSLEAREMHVGSRIGGRVKQVHVKESDMVKEKDVLVTLEADELDAQKKEARAALDAAEARERELRCYRTELVKQAEALMEEQRQNLNKVQNGPREQEIQTQKEVMNAADTEYRFAESEYKRIESQRGSSSDQERDQARQQREVARARWNAEKKRYELLIAGSRPEDIAIAMHRLEQAKAEYERLKAGPRIEEQEHAKAVKEEISARIERIEAQLKECRIEAPTAGRVEICNLEPGDMLAAGQTAVTLLKPQDLWVKIYIKEYELDRVKVEQRVSVVAETSQPQKDRSIALEFLYSLVNPPPVVRVFPGRIVHIASQAEFTPRNVQTKDERGNQVFAVKVEILEPADILRPGISVEVQE